MRSTRLLRDGAAAIVAGIAGLASYTHQRDLALAYGQTRLVASLVPVTTDALMLVATLVMLDDRQQQRPVRASAWLAFGAGVAASVTANVLAAEPSWTARTISAWPAVCLLPVVELLARGGKGAATSRTRADGSEVEQSAAEAGPDPVEVEARSIVAELGTVGRDRLAAELRSRGHRVSTHRAGVLARAVRDST